MDKHKRLISGRILQCVVWLLNDNNSGRQAGVFLSNLYTPILEKIQDRQQKMTEKLMKQMQNGELENIDPLGLNSGQALTSIKDDDEPLEEVNTLVTEGMIEEVILDFIVVKDGQTKQNVLDEIYTYDYTQYLKITKGFLDDKGMFFYCIYLIKYNLLFM